MNPQALESRLAELAKFDAAAADWLRPALRDVRPVKDDGAPLEADAAAPGPELVIAFGRPSPPQLQSLLGSLGPDARLFLLERDPTHAAALFAGCALERHVADGRLTLAFGNDAAEIENRFFEALRVSDAPAFRLVDAGGSTPE